MTNKTKGYLLGAVAAATYGMNPLFVMPLYHGGMDTDSVVFFRYLFAVPILGVMLKIRGRSLKLKKKEILPLFVMGFLISISSLTLFESYNYMDIGIASTLLFVYPIMVAIIMAICFKERINKLTIFCIFLTLAGIGLLYNGEGEGGLNLIGTLLVMSSALLYALYIVGVNYGTLKEIATLKLTFYALFFGMLIFFVRADFGTSLQVVDKWYLWLDIIALAVFPTAISFLCTTSAVQYVGSTPTAILGALEPVTAVFFGVVVFKEELTLRLLLGILLIIFSVTMIIAGSNIKTHLVRFRKMFPRLPHRKPKPIHSENIPK